MLISKEFSFDSAHFLPNYHGKCEKLHGHTYRLRVTVDAPIDEKTGMAVDFCEIKRLVQEKVLQKLDHTNLNEIIPLPSAENISVWVWEELKNDLPLYEIRVWETQTSFVSYFGPNNETRK